MAQMNGVMDNFMRDNAMDMQAGAADEGIRDQIIPTMDEFLEQVSGPQDANGEIASDVEGDKAEIQDITKVETWLGEINPNFNPYDADDRYENNCGCCAYAVSQRLEGKEDISSGPDNIGTEEGMEAITGHEFKETSPEEISSSLIDKGPGAHAIVGIDRVEGPGHWFNVYCPDGKNVYYVDGQNNMVEGWPPKDLGNISRWVMEIKEAGE